MQKPLPKGWKWVKLGETLKTSSGGTPLKSKSEYYTGGTIPWLRSGEVSQGLINQSELKITKLGLSNSSAKVFPIDTILIAMYGATAGQVGLLKIPSSTNQAICGIFPDKSYVPEFLFYYLRTQTQFIIQLSGGGAQPNISQAIIKKLAIPLPPLPVQQKIVEILEEANRLRTLRRDADEKMKSLIPALFVDMFGDPATNPKGWPVKKLGDLCAVKGGGTPSKAKPEFWQGDIPWVSPKDIIGPFVSNAIDHISEVALTESATTLIPVNSLLVVTRSGILKHTLPVSLTTTPVAINQDIKAFIPTCDIEPYFLLVQILQRSKEILSLVRVGATVQNIETESLKRLSFLLPPLPLQQQFASIVADIEVEKQRQSASRTKLNDLFDSLLHRAFNGELVT